MKKLVLALTLLALVVPANATVLTFQFANSGNVPNTWDLSTGGYGNHVTGESMFAYSDSGNDYYYGYQQGTSGWTPNVAVSYSPTDTASSYMTPYAWPQGFAVGVFEYDPTGTCTVPMEYTFTGSNGNQAALYSFRAAVWPGCSYVDLPYSVLDASNNVLASGTFTINDGNPVQDITFDPGIVKADTLKLVINTVGFDGWGDMAIGNIEFGQVAAPEPMTMTLLGLGAIALFRKK